MVQVITSVSVLKGWDQGLFILAQGCSGCEWLFITHPFHLKAQQQQGNVILLIHSRSKNQQSLKIITQDGYLDKNRAHSQYYISVHLMRIHWILTIFPIFSFTQTNKSPLERIGWKRRSEAAFCLLLRDCNKSPCGPGALFDNDSKIIPRGLWHAISMDVFFVMLTFTVFPCIYLIINYKTNYVSLFLLF